jgi:hypothetical protein
MGVAPNSTGDDRESFRVLCLGWPGSGFIKLVRETLSKNEVLPGLTCFYCNWVSQGGNVLLGCESEKRSRTVAAVRKATSRKAREMAHPQLFRSLLKDKPALYFAIRVAHPL